MTNDEMLKECTDKLNVIAINVTSDDKKQAVKDLGLHYITVHRYLNNEVKNIDTGIKLYNFLSKRIAARKAILEPATAQ